MRATASILTLQDAKAVGHSLEQVTAAVASTLRVGRLDLFSPHRAAHLVEARHILYWCARYFTARSYPEIGRYINRDHCTIMHGVRKVDRNLERYVDRIKAVATALGINFHRKEAA